MSRRFVIRAVTLTILCIITLVLWADYWVTSSTQKQLYSDISLIPKNKVGLLLGTAKHIKKGIINPYYQNRIDAAVDLYMSGKVDYILISGDNSTLHYNEPKMMRNDLMARGIPAEKIFIDDAGLRTLDSILRCRDIFGEDHFTIISQPFHNERALFIANHKNINAIAFNAKDVPEDLGLKVMAREKLARVKMLLDLLFNTQAKYYYGSKIEIK
jgi:SanA protein